MENYNFGEEGFIAKIRKLFNISQGNYVRSLSVVFFSFFFLAFVPSERINLFQLSEIHKRRKKL